jgi:hypothetical protein
MAQDSTRWLVSVPPTLHGPAPPGGDYRYSEVGGYIQLVLISERALRWFQAYIFADAFEWLSPTEPKLPWGGETADLLRLMRESGLRKEG